MCRNLDNKLLLVIACPKTIRSVVLARRGRSPPVRGALIIRLPWDFEKLLAQKWCGLFDLVDCFDLCQHVSTAEIWWHILFVQLIRLKEI